MERSLRAMDEADTPPTLGAFMLGLNGDGVAVIWPNGTIYLVKNENRAKATAARTVSMVRGTLAAPRLERFASGAPGCTIGVPRSQREVEIHFEELLDAIKTRSNGMKTDDRRDWFENVVSFRSMVLQRTLEAWKGTSSELSAGSKATRSSTQFSDFAVIIAAVHGLTQRAVLRNDPGLLNREFSATMETARRFLAMSNSNVAHGSHTWPMLTAFFMFKCSACHNPLATEYFCNGTCKDKLPPGLSQPAGGASDQAFSAEFAAWRLAHAGTLPDQKASYGVANPNKSVFAGKKGSAPAPKGKIVDAMAFHSEMLKSQHLLSLPVDVLRASHSMSA